RQIQTSFGRPRDIMESLEKQLICPICLEMFTKPVVILPCQHNLCRKCANDVFQASNPYLSTRSGTTVASGGRFRCPSCRHEVILDRHGVYGLQRNLLVENIIDMYKQGSTSKPVPEVKLDQPMCEDHEGEKINIYCITCGIPTCSLCKVFGAHKDCQVAPLNDIFSQQKVKQNNQSINQGNQSHIQSCRSTQEKFKQQKSKVCEMFDHLFALLEERKGEMTVRINAEQDEKLNYIRNLTKKYTEHLDSTAKLVETAIQTMDESEMAVFLQTAKPLLQKIVEGTSTSHLDKVQRGYENMDHFTANFELQRKALSQVDFIKLDEDDDDDEDEVEIRSSAGSRAESHHHVGPVAAASSQPPPQSPVPPTQRHSEAPPTPRPLETPPIPRALETPPVPRALQTSPTPRRLEASPTPPSHTKNPSSSGPAPSPLPLPTASSASQSDQQSEADDKDGPKHVFSFSWLNQK
uniref:Tripartite motif-containing protein 54 n=1 Tax=Salarias fasciatus TaxID=181472 RepID=A0A672FVX4_SALFA